MSAERHVLHGHLDIDDLPLLELDLPLSVENLVSDRAGHAVSWHDDHVLLPRAPLLEDLQRQPAVQHARGGEDDHGAGVLQVRAVERADVLELEHVSLHEGAADLLVRPRDEHLVVVVGLLGQAGAEVDGHFQVHALPVSLQENAQLLKSTKCLIIRVQYYNYHLTHLCPAESEYWNENFAALLHTVVDLLEEVSLPTSLRVPDCRGVGGLGNEQVRTTLVDPKSCNVALNKYGKKAFAIDLTDHAAPRCLSGVML